MVKVQRLLFAGLLTTVPFFSFSFLNINDVPIGRPDIIVASLLAIVFVLSVLAGRRKLIFNHSMVWILLLGVATLLSAVNALFIPNFSFTEFATVAGQIVLASVVVLAVSNLRVDKRRLTLFLQTWLWTAAAVGAYAIYQALARNLGWPLAYLDLSNPTFTSTTAAGQFGSFIRPSSVFFEPSRLGTYLVAPTLLAMLTLAGPQRSSLIFRRKTVHQILLTMIVGGLLLSFAMSGYLAIGAAALVMLVSSRGRIDKNLLRIVGVGTLIAIALVIFANQFLNVDFLSAFERISRLVSSPTTDGSILERAARVIVGLRIWADYPILGVGGNQIQFVSGNYTFPSWYSDNYGNRAFATSGVIWISLLGQAGIIGFFALVFAFGSSLSALRRITKLSTDPYSKALSQAFYLMLWAAAAYVSLSFVELQLWVQFAVIHLFINNVRRIGSDKSEPVRISPIAS